jgi:catechol 2,3-dioxygenase-like lactoylglutathione lyase family enzyme
MEEVLGLGAFAISARDPEALARWYRDRLGLRMVAGPRGTLMSLPPGVPEALALRAFALPGGRPATVGLTFKVRALDALVAQLQRAGVPVDNDPDIHPHGVFARLTDPEGNSVVLWEAILGDARD